MNFYEAQRDAAKRTRMLVVIFTLVVVMAALAVGLIVALLAGRALLHGDADAGPSLAEVWRYILDYPHTLLYGAAATAGFILVVALVQRARMGGTGAGVAEMLGGRRVDANAPDPRERQFVNVAQEMAIASGMPVPQLYVIPGEGINAFAAGAGPKSATVAVTEGALQKLNRAELQGVVAHEYGHLLSGDVLVNMRMMAMLAGLAALVTLGRVLLYSGGMGRRRSSNGGGGGVAMVGLVVMLVGGLSAALGGFLRLALSRQREYAADAQAVRLTRNPQGIGQALIKLAAAGDLVRHPRAGEVRQFFLSEGTHKARGGQKAVAALGGGLLATHPPLGARIGRILPEWNGDLAPAQRELLRAERRAPDPASAVGEDAGPGSGARGGGERRAESGAGAPGAVPEAALAALAGLAGGAGGTLAGRMGETGDRDPVQARQLLERSPDQLLEATQPGEAHLLALALLLEGAWDAAAPDPRQPGGKAALWLSQELPAPQWREVVRLHGALQGLRREQRLALLEMAAPALAALSLPEARRLRRRMRDLVRADGVVHLWEWIVCDLAAVALPGERRKPSRAGLRRISLHLLAILAQVGGAPQGFGRGAQVLGYAGAEAPEVRFDPQELSAQMERLARAQLAFRARFLDAARACVAADAEILEEEAVLVRAIAARLDLPLPLSVFD